MEEVKNQLVSYETQNGQVVELNNSIIRQLTGNNPKITNDEVALFISLCQNLKLNPLIREAYLVKYDDKKPAQQIVSLGAFMRIAEDNPQFDGMEDGVIVQSGDKIIERQGTLYLPNEKLLGGWAKVYRKDRTRPTVVKINLKEYSKGQSTWLAMPSTMINKCAKVGALRSAFPNSFNNCYGEGEMPESKQEEQQLEKQTIDITDMNINNEPTPPVETNEDEIIVVEDLEEIPANEFDEDIFTEEEKTEILQEVAELVPEQPQEKVAVAVEKEVAQINTNPNEKEITYKEYYNNKDKYQMVKDSYREEIAENGFVKKFIRVIPKVQG